MRHVVRPPACGRADFQGSTAPSCWRAGAYGSSMARRLRHVGAPERRHPHGHSHRTIPTTAPRSSTGSPVGRPHRTSPTAKILVRAISPSCPIGRPWSSDTYDKLLTCGYIIRWRRVKHLSAGQAHGGSSRVQTAEQSPSTCPRVTHAKRWPAVVATPTSASPSLRCDPDNGFATEMTNDTQYQRAVLRVRSALATVSALARGGGAAAGAGGRGRGLDGHARSYLERGRWAVQGVDRRPSIRMFSRRLARASCSGG